MPAGSSGSQGRLIRLVTVAPVVVVLALAGPQLALIAAYTSGTAPVVWALALMACCLPISVHHVWHAARGRRAPGAPWTLAALTVIIAAGPPLVGYEWTTTFAYLLASAVIVLPRRWVFPAGGLVLAALVPASLWLSARPNPLWTMIVVVERAGAILVPVWLAGALRGLRAAREELATRAVLRERIRIDSELSQTVGESLAEIAAHGAEAAATDPDTAERELTTLVHRSRRTLADARLLIRGYQRVWLGAELDTAVALLTAAGVSTRLVVPRDLPEADPDLSVALRAAVDGLLRDPVPRCVITVDRAGDGRLHLTVEGTREPVLAPR